MPNTPIVTLPLSRTLTFSALFHHAALKTKALPHFDSVPVPCLNQDVSMLYSGPLLTQRDLTVWSVLVKQSLENSSWDQDTSIPVQAFDPLAYESPAIGQFSLSAILNKLKSGILEADSRSHRFLVPKQPLVQDAAIVDQELIFRLSSAFLSFFLGNEKHDMQAQEWSNLGTSELDRKVYSLMVFGSAETPTNASFIGNSFTLANVMALLGVQDTQAVVSSLKRLVQSGRLTALMLTENGSVKPWISSAGFKTTIQRISAASSPSLLWLDRGDDFREILHKTTGKAITTWRMGKETRDKGENASYIASLIEGAGSASACMRQLRETAEKWREQYDAPQPSAKAAPAVPSAVVENAPRTEPKAESKAKPVATVRKRQTESRKPATEKREKERAQAVEKITAAAMAAKEAVARQTVRSLAYSQIAAEESALAAAAKAAVQAQERAAAKPAHEAEKPAVRKQAAPVPSSCATLAAGVVTAKETTRSTNELTNEEKRRIAAQFIAEHANWRELLHVPAEPKREARPVIRTDLAKGNTKAQTLIRLNGFDPASPEQIKDRSDLWAIAVYAGTISEDSYTADMYLRIGASDPLQQDNHSYSADLICSARASAIAWLLYFDEEQQFPFSQRRFITKLLEKTNGDRFAAAQRLLNAASTASDEQILAGIAPENPAERQWVNEYLLQKALKPTDEQYTEMERVISAIFGDKATLTMRKFLVAAQIRRLGTAAWEHYQE